MKTLKLTVLSSYLVTKLKIDRSKIEVIDLILTRLIQVIILKKNTLK
jgi:hypothetical protein